MNRKILIVLTCMFFVFKIAISSSSHNLQNVQSDIKYRQSTQLTQELITSHAALPNTPSLETDSSHIDASAAAIAAGHFIDHPDAMQSTKGSSSHRSKNSKATNKATREQFKCRFCGQKLENKAQRNAHEWATHQKDSKNVCLPCKKCFISPSLLKVHEKSIMHRKQLVVTSGNSSSSSSTLNVPKKISLLKCSFAPCTLEFDTSKERMDHQWDAHRSATLFRCYTCKKCYTNDDSLKSHKASSKHTVNAQSRRASYKLSSETSISSAANPAALTTNTAHVEYRCEICDRNFDKKSNYKGHLKTKLHQENELLKSSAQDTYAGEQPLTLAEIQAKLRQFKKTKIAQQALIELAQGQDEIPHAAAQSSPATQSSSTTNSSSASHANAHTTAHAKRKLLDKADSDTRKKIRLSDEDQ